MTDALKPTVFLQLGGLGVPTDTLTAYPWNVVREIPGATSFAGGSYRSFTLVVSGDAAPTTEGATLDDVLKKLPERFRGAFTTITTLRMDAEVLRDSANTIAGHLTRLTRESLANGAADHLIETRGFILLIRKLISGTEIETTSFDARALLKDVGESLAPAEMIAFTLMPLRNFMARLIEIIERKKSLTTTAPTSSAPTKGSDNKGGRNVKLDDDQRSTLRAALSEIGKKPSRPVEFPERPIDDTVKGFLTGIFSAVDLRSVRTHRDAASTIWNFLKGSAKNNFLQTLAASLLGKTRNVELQSEIEKTFAPFAHGIAHVGNSLNFYPVLQLCYRVGGLTWQTPHEGLTQQYSVDENHRFDVQMRVAQVHYNISVLADMADDLAPADIFKSLVEINLPKLLATTRAALDSNHASLTSPLNTLPLALVHVPAADISQKNLEDTLAEIVSTYRRIADSLLN